MRKKQLIIIKSIHCFLLNRADADCRISRRRLEGMLGMLMHIPKDFRKDVIKELEYFGIITNKDKYFQIEKI